MDKQGLLLCAKYSAAPNFFGYCGPDKNANLADHLHENIADREVEVILSEFETLHLNLTLIARENKIPNVFDSKVVEAYWVGNDLLQHIKPQNYTALLSEKFKLPVKLGDEGFAGIRRKMHSYRLYPHHSFHVFNIFKRTGNDPSFHTLKTMDECRISWGKVVAVKPDFGYTVETRPLILTGTKLSFGKPLRRDIHIDYKGKTVYTKAVAGDWISFHWGRFCDVLSEAQMKHLEFYTRQAVAFFNAPNV